MNYVKGKVPRFEPPRVFQYTFAMGQNDKASRATIELVPETEATRVTVTHDEWAEDDPTYASCSDGELLLGRKGEYSAAIASEQLRDADPEYLVVAPCGFSRQRSLREQGVLERHPWWRDLQAIRNGNVAFADGNLFFNRSGMTVSQTAEIIAEILHGVSFGGRTEEVSWRRVESPVERVRG
jgi:hypothetical protein